MGLSAPLANSIEIIVLQPVLKLPGIKTMVLTNPRDEYLDINSSNPIKNCYGLTQ